MRELRQRLLADATRALAGSLDYQATLQQVEVAVPDLADWCGVDLPGRGGHPRRRGDRPRRPRADRPRPQAARALPGPPGCGDWPARVVREGCTELVASVADEDIAAAADESICGRCRPSASAPPDGPARGRRPDARRPDARALRPRAAVLRTGPGAGRGARPRRCRRRAGAQRLAVHRAHHHRARPAGRPPSPAEASSRRPPASRPRRLPAGGRELQRGRRRLRRSPRRPGG